MEEKYRLSCQTGLIEIFKPTGHVTDITYIACGQRFYYLSAVQDLYNNEIVAWKLSKRNDLELVMKTVESLTAQRDVQGAILHSDQGFQYTTKAYQKRLDAVGLKGSHSRKGNCLDNACIESFFSHLKTENTYFSSCQTKKSSTKALKITSSSIIMSDSRKN